MVVVNTSGSEINAKVVYYGPALGGKTTNLEQIYERMPSDAKGKMVSMKTRTDRTLFFDFLPLELGQINGCRTRMLLYTVPGQVYYNATRKLVLKGADAVVFVADSETSKLGENIESLRNLEENLNELGLTLDTVPWVIQYNKRDLPDAAPIRTLENELNLLGVPAFEAIAKQGLGVYETFQGVARILYSRLAKRFSVPEQPAAHIASMASAERPERASSGDSDRVVSDVIDVALREIEDVERAAASTVGAAGKPVRNEIRYAASGDASRPTGPTQPPRDDPARDATNRQLPPAKGERGDDAFRFVSLDGAPMDESVGRIVDFEQSQAGDHEQDDNGAANGLFITDPCRSREEASAETGETAERPSTMGARPNKGKTGPAEDECVITVPVVLSRSQIRKTIPIKLRLEVEIDDGEG